MGKVIEGLGIVFNKESQPLGGFCEVISPTAVGPNGKVIKDSDILFLINHTYEKGVLARCNQGKGSMTLTLTPEGVRYSFEAPPTAIGEELVSNIARGEINTSSFSFLIAAGGETWEKRENDYLRTITAFSGVYDISAVYKAAYLDTSCTLRSADVLSRSNDEWQESFARAQRSGSPKDEQRKMKNVLELLDLKPGDTVSGDELLLMVRLLQERGVEVPDSIAPTAKQMHTFKTAYTRTAHDLKPTIKRAYRLSPEDQALWDKYITVKDGPKK